jgi:hypothetical protein
MRSPPHVTALVRSGASRRTSGLGTGKTSTENKPATATRTGICCDLINSITGRRDRDAFRKSQAVRRFWAENLRPDSDASITTGRPANVPESRPVIISLGAYLCPEYEF